MVISMSVVKKLAVILRNSPLASPITTAVNGTFTFIDDAITHRLIRALFFAGFFLFFALCFANLRVEYGGLDYWQHLAAIHELSLAPFSPAPLYIDAPYQVHLYTPYHLFWGLVLSTGMLDIWGVGALAALANIGLFYVGCRLIARNFLGDVRYDMILAASLLLLWGTPIWWSGVYSLGQVGLQAVYPSFFALSLSMIFVATFSEPYQRSWRWRFAYGFLVSIIFLSHPITASVMLVLTGIKVLSFERPFTVMRAAESGMVLAFGLGLALLWPYYSVLTLVSSAQSGPDFFGDIGVFYEKPLQQTGAAFAGLAGLAALTLWRRSPKTLFLALSLVTLTLLYTGNYVFHVSHIFSRYLIYIILILQLSAVLAVLTFKNTNIGRVIFLGYAALLAVSFFPQLNLIFYNSYGFYWDYKQQTSIGAHRAVTPYADLEAVAAEFTDPASLVLTESDIAYPIAAIYSPKLLAPPIDAPTMPDYAGRMQAAQHFLSNKSTCAEKREITADWKVTHIIIRNSHPIANAPCGLTKVLNGEEITVLRTAQR